MGFHNIEVGIRASDPGLVFTLRVLAAWRMCSVCSKLVLYVDERGRTTDSCLCGDCLSRQNRLELELLSDPL